MAGSRSPDVRPERPGPIRTCVGCRRKAPAIELIRVVATADGSLVPGRPGRDGRGAWLCAERPECLDLASRRGFARAFRRPIDAAAVGRLRAIVSGRGRMDDHARFPTWSAGRTERT